MRGVELIRQISFYSALSKSVFCLQPFPHGICTPHRDRLVQWPHVNCENLALVCITMDKFYFEQTKEFVGEIHFLIEFLKIP